MSAITTLRAQTSELHDQVDAAFSAYSLDGKASYRRFLLAHAHALVPAEALLSRESVVPAWRPRTPLLASDLTVLGSTMPTPLPLAIDTRPGYAWGILYVLEGSRLGGRLLANMVPASFPALYVGAIHEPGEWRATRDGIEAHAAAGGAEWLDGAVLGARVCFDLYLRAAAASPP